jgi:hypothetical protein
MSRLRANGHWIGKQDSPKVTNKAEVDEQKEIDTISQNNVSLSNETTQSDAVTPCLPHSLRLSA